MEEGEVGILHRVFCGCLSSLEIPFYGHLWELLIYLSLSECFTLVQGSTNRDKSRNVTLCTKIRGDSERSVGTSGSVEYFT